MTKQELKKLIRETLSEAGMSDATYADPRNLALPELNRWKATCKALSDKISVAMIGKPMTGELVKGTRGARSPIQTNVKRVDVELSYKTDSSEESGFYVSVYAMGNQGQAGMSLFADYV